MEYLKIRRNCTVTILNIMAFKSVLRTPSFIFLNFWASSSHLSVVSTSPSNRLLLWPSDVFFIITGTLTIPSNEMKSSTERVHPNCVNASNPFHECGVHCREKIAQGPARKDKKSLGYSNGKLGDLLKIPGGERKVNPSCPKSSNPYHECNEYCVNGFSNGAVAGVSQRKKKIELVPQESIGKSEGSSRKISSSGSSNSSDSLSSQPQSDDSLKDSEHNLEKGSAQLGRQDDTLAAYGCDGLPKQKYGLTVGSLQVVTAVESSLTNDSVVRDSISVVLDSYVSVGVYKVRPRLSATLQSILNKYGDIAANSSLESNSLCSFHLECISSVVQDMQTTPFERWTKAKMRETVAVIKDAESARIDVAWLRRVVNELNDSMSSGDEYRKSKKGKEKCVNETENSREATESLEEELVAREEKVAETMKKIEEKKMRLKDSELESTKQINIHLPSAQLKLEALL